MDALLYNIIKVLVIITITLIVRFGVPLAKEWMKNSKFKNALKWVEIAVDAAEQTIRESGAGVEKKAIVTKFLKEILTAENISISDDQLEGLIEAAVFAMNNGKARE